MAQYDRMKGSGKTAIRTKTVGLYNRANSKMFLKPFTLLENEQYLKKQEHEMERYDIAQAYMIMGGIPYYLKQLESGRTLADNIETVFQDKRHNFAQWLLFARSLREVCAKFARSLREVS